jgi:hypothetical protein
MSKSQNANILLTGKIMQSTPNDASQSTNLIKQSSDSLPEQAREGSSARDLDAEDLKVTLTSKIPSFRLSRLILGGLLLLGIVATFFLLTKGSEFCFLSTCNDIQSATQSTEAGDFWAFTGGTAALVVLTTFMGVSLLPALGISTVIWYLMHMSL